MNGWWAWLSHCYPAGPNNDINIHTIEYNSIIKKLDKRGDSVLVDLGWWSETVKNDSFFIVGHKKPRKGKLSEEQTNENDVLGHFRGLFQNKQRILRLN